jgi:hypothetical protein
VTSSGVSEELLAAHWPTESNKHTQPGLKAPFFLHIEGTNNPPEISDLGGRACAVHNDQIADLRVRRSRPVDSSILVHQFPSNYFITANGENTGKSTHKLLKSDNLKMLVLPWPMFPVIFPAHNNVGTSRRMIV